MSFLKGLGKGLGDVSGAVMGGSIKAVGEVTNIEFIQDVGNGVEQSMQMTGKVVGNLADGLADIGIGVLENDKETKDQGLNNIGRTSIDFGNQVGNSLKAIGEQGVTAVSAVAEGDYDTAKKAGVGLAKVAVISTLAVGLIDVVDGVDGSSLAFADGDLPADQIENLNTHDVTPHERLLPSGETIWVDGDGDTSVDRNFGWSQTNPNYKA